jgi:hypothetical protein
MLLSPCGNLKAEEGIHLVVTMADGNNSLDFGQIKSLQPDGSPVRAMTSKEMVLTIRTDLNQRYIVSQIANTLPTGSGGSVCPSEAMRYTVRIKNGSGEIRTPSRSVLRQGTEDVFISGLDGSAAEIVILYELAVPAGQKAGYYNSSITYKVSTI